jgi:hypothetical protein
MLEVARFVNLVLAGNELGTEVALVLATTRSCSLT